MGDSQRNRVSRLTVGSLLVAVSALGGWWSCRATSQKQLVETLRSGGFSVFYDHDYRETWTRHVPERLVNLLGIDFFEEVRGVQGYHQGELTVEHLRRLRRLDSLRHLQISISHSDEPTFREIGELSTLESLVLSTPTFAPEQLSHLVRLQNLQDIRISRPIGDEGLSVLCRMARLRRITISSVGLTQEGIQQLAALKNLEFLKLNGNLDVSSETRQVLDGVAIDDGSHWRLLDVGVLNLGQETGTPPSESARQGNTGRSTQEHHE